MSFKKMVFFSICTFSIANAETLLSPGQAITIGDEVIRCSPGDGVNHSKVDIDCVKFEWELNNDNKPPIDLVRDWVDSCRNVPIRHPMTPKVCTVVDSRPNYECVNFVRTIYPGVNSEIVMKFQLDCKDLTLNCPSF
jgi:hypothetical protein